MTRVAGKYALVTGGASGIGLSTVERLVSEGATVAVLDRDVDELRSGDVVAIQCDVADEESVRTAIGRLQEQWPSIDVLVNSAGIVKKALSHEMPLATWDSVIAVNLTGSFLTSREVAAWMVRTETPGAIVNIASVDAHAAERRELAYNVSKSGILSLTRTMAIERVALGRGLRPEEIASACF